MAKHSHSSPVQGDLFASLPPPAYKPPTVDVAKIRRDLLAMLADLRGSEEGSPWPYEKLRYNRVVFPQMANWLPTEERDQIRLDFAAELKRLDIAA